MTPSIANALAIIVAGIHALIATVEMVLWGRPAVHGRLGFTEMEAKKAAPIVANAGLYNAFVAAGILWSVLSPAAGPRVVEFFLGFVVLAGLFGAATLKWTTLVIQSLPGMIALVASRWTHP